MTARVRARSGVVWCGDQRAAWRGGWPPVHSAPAPPLVRSRVAVFRVGVQCVVCSVVSLPCVCRRVIGFTRKEKIGLYLRHRASNKWP